MMMTVFLPYAACGSKSGQQTDQSIPAISGVQWEVEGGADLCQSREGARAW